MAVHAFIPLEDPLVKYRNLAPVVVLLAGLVGCGNGSPTIRSIPTAKESDVHIRTPGVNVDVEHKGKGVNVDVSKKER